MNEQQHIQIPPSDLQDFFDLVPAENPNWLAYDKLVYQRCNRQEYIDWTAVGLKEKINTTAKDLAISLLEKTELPILDERRQELAQIRDTDPDIHLRGKAAIALAAKNDRDDATKQALLVAQQDEELKDRAIELINLFDN